MTLAEKSGTLFQFNFLGGGKTKFEGYYKIDDPQIKALMEQMISRGHIIGLHPSYDTYQDTAMIRQEKKAVEASAGVTISKSRQHYLRFADGVIVGSSLKRAGRLANPVDPKRVAALVRAMR